MPAPIARDVLVLGGSGYVGRALIEQLVRRGHRVRALVRAGSERKVPEGAATSIGSALEARDIRNAMLPGDTLVQLVGTPHPAPWKGEEFERVDLASALAAVQAAREAKAAHLVYVSVAHPAPAMRAYVSVRERAEAAIDASGVRATILRPWYILGPGHRWPVALIPLYALAERFPSYRDSARRLGLVTHRQMVQALVRAIEQPNVAAASRIVDVPHIRAAQLEVK